MPAMMSEPQGVTENGAGLCGKLPACPDFVRENLSDPVSPALLQWMENGVERIAMAGLSLPPSHVRFLFSVPGMPKALVGVLAPSRDRVGRSFPVAVFYPIPVRFIVGNLAAVPAASEGFFSAAGQLLAESAGLQHPEIIDRLRSLAPPDGPSLREHALPIRQALAAETAAGFAERLFGELSQGRHAYAYHTFRIAAANGAAHPETRSPTVLDCPVDIDLDLLAWLELADKLLGWTDRVPSAFWTALPLPRLLIALGAAPGAILHYLADRSFDSARLWPLTTERSAAIQQANALLGAALSAYHDGTRSVAELFEALHHLDGP